MMDMVYKQHQDPISLSCLQALKEWSTDLIFVLFREIEI